MGAMMKSVAPFSTWVFSLSVSVSAVLFPFTSPDARSFSNDPPPKMIIVRGWVSEVDGEFHMAKDQQGADTLKIVDKSYVIVSQAGEEVRLELNNDTKIRERLNPGDRIEANVSPEGRMISVIRIE